VPNTFGVTPATVAARIQNLTISTTSDPSYATVEEVIGEIASQLEDECAAMGIDASSAVDSGGTATLYKQIRAALIYGVADSVLTARRRGTGEIERPYKVLYDETIDRIRRRPQTVSAESGVDVTVNLGAPEYARQTFVPGLPGKILRGGL
jgi:hypothetical protein